MMRKTLVEKPDKAKLKLIKECGSCKAFLGCFIFPNGLCHIRDDKIVKIQ